MKNPSPLAPVRILYLEDNPQDRELVSAALTAEALACDFVYAETEAEFQTALRQAAPDLIFCDFTLPSYSGMAALEMAREQRPDIPFVFVSGTIGEERAVECMKAGATDYVVKDHLQHLAPAVRRALQISTLRRAGREAEEKLRDSEHRARLLFERAPAAFYLHDLNGIFVDGNQAAEELIGYARPELIGKSFLQLNLLDQEGLTRAAAGLAQNALGKPDGPKEYFVRRKDGVQITVELHTYPVRIQEQVLVLGIARDVTERKRAEIRLSIFSALGQRLSSSQTAKDAARIIVEAADQLLGWDACLCDLYSAKDDTISDVLLIDLINGQRTECHTLRNSQPPTPTARRVIQDGGLLILRQPADNPCPDPSQAFGDEQRASASILFVPIRKDKAVIGILSIQSYRRDAYTQYSLDTLQALADHCGGALDRIRAQEDLETTQKRLDHLVAQSPAVIYSLSIRNKNLVPSWMSHSIERLLGYSSKDALAPGWWHAQLHPDDRQAVFDNMLPLLTQDQIVRDYRIRHKNGNYLWVRDEQRLVCDAAGRPVEVIGSWVDVTERKALEEQLRQAQKMEGIGQLAGGVAHDFNNLLAVIHGNTELALMDSEQLPPQARECLTQVVSAAERAANLTRQLLAFSRKQVMQPQPLSLNDLIANLAKMLKRIIREDLRLQCDYAPDLPLVQADPGMIEQVLVNLVVNARDAMPTGGTLFISTEICQFQSDRARPNPEARSGHFVRLSVRDTGAGIPAEILPRIFEPFFTTKEAGKGTGLGLAMVYGITKQHHGWIEVASEPGNGAAFDLYLPALPASAQSAGVLQEELPMRGGSERILLAEDDFSVRMMTNRVLETFGYHVWKAASGREALEIWKANADLVDLLLTDLVMPDGVTGMDLAKQLRAERPSLKIIFMSGYSPDVAGTDTEFLRRTKSHYLQKPWSTHALLKAVRKALDENQTPQVQQSSNE